MGFKIETEYEQPPIRRTVGSAGTSGRVYVPKGWVGRAVDVALVPDVKKAKAQCEEAVDCNE